MRGMWRRVMPGVYQHRLHSRLQVKTYCECGDNCTMRWAVYWDDVAGADQSLFFPTRARATQAAFDFYTSPTFTP